LAFGDVVAAVARGKRPLRQPRAYTSVIASGHTVYIRIHLQQLPPISVLSRTERWMRRSGHIDRLCKPLPVVLYCELYLIGVAQQTMERSLSAIRATQLIINSAQ
jgi:hypothetical protein